MKVYAFDFDGTLTTSDTLLAFIRHAKGSGTFLLGFLLHLPWLVLMKLRLYPNWKCKQRVFAWFFRGMPLADFDRLCQQFALERRDLLRPAGQACLRAALTEGSRVVIVSASIDNWVRPFFDLPVTVVGTRVEVADGRLTGRFATSNCYGAEKVRRLTELLPDRTAYQLIAYGDSRGDRELLAFADEAHYKPFRP